MKIVARTDTVFLEGSRRLCVGRVHLRVYPGLFFQGKLQKIAKNARENLGIWDPGKIREIQKESQSEKSLGYFGIPLGKSPKKSRGIWVKKSTSKF